MIALIDYNMGNLLSVNKALETIGADVIVTSDPDVIKNADSVVLPGVGNFGDGIDNLISLGLKPVIQNVIESGKPFLGICLGLQLLFDESEEAPGKKGLGIIPGKVVEFKLDDKSFKVPHMGWNSIKYDENSTYFTGIKQESYFYFVHSFYVVPVDKNMSVVECDYGIKFCAGIKYKKVLATQFHPEKSQELGLTLLRNFVDL